MTDNVYDFSSDDDVSSLYNDIETTDDVTEITPVATSIIAEAKKHINTPTELTKEKLIRAAQVSVLNLQEKTEMYDTMSMDIATILKQKVVDKADSLSVPVLVEALKAIDSLSIDNRVMFQDIMNPAKQSSDGINILFNISDQKQEQTQAISSDVSHEMSKLLDISKIVLRGNKSKPIDVTPDEDDEDDS